MIDLSNTCISVLLLFRDSAKTFPADELPAGVDIPTVDYLVSLGLLERLTLVPPGMKAEGYGPRGLAGYRINEAGREQLRLYQEMLHQRDQEAAEKEADKAEAQFIQNKVENTERFRFWLRLIVDLAIALSSALAGGLIEHNTGWIGSLFTALGLFH